MTDHHDDLVDYEEDDDVIQSINAVPTAAQPDAAEEAKDKKGSYVGVHSTGFRDFLLKPELLRAIVDCGFEHPSEGKPCFVLFCLIRCGGSRPMSIPQTSV